MTVEKLRGFLKDLPPGLLIVSVGPDCGGYDCEIGRNVLLTQDGSNVYIYHNGSDDPNWISNV